MGLHKTARISTGALDGIAGLAVTAEMDISRGLPGFHLVGLPDAEVRESRERVLSALRNSGHEYPSAVTVNLAPAGVRKSGASLTWPWPSHVSRPGAGPTGARPALAGGLPG